MYLNHFEQYLTLVKERQEGRRKETKTFIKRIHEILSFSLPSKRVIFHIYHSNTDNDKNLQTRDFKNNGILRWIRLDENKTRDPIMFFSFLSFFLLSTKLFFPSIFVGKKRRKELEQKTK